MDGKKDTGDPLETTLGADLEFCHTVNLFWGTGDLTFSTITSVLKDLRFASLRTRGAFCRASPLLFTQEKPQLRIFFLAQKIGFP